MEAQLKGAVLIALVVVPQTAPHPGWQDGTILQPGLQGSFLRWSLLPLLSFTATFAFKPEKSTSSFVL